MGRPFFRLRLKAAPVCHERRALETKGVEMAADALSSGQIVSG